ncbi:MAG: class I SAM-dependent methyltransferase [Anaerolineales bacterium]|nr:class I SAM-dependent methyltransferase [Anaerolineales bacterium]
MHPLAILLLAAAVPAAASDTNPHSTQPKIDPARIVRMPEQSMKLEDFPAEGWILDIGGGGEGVIGRLKGSQVVAIDLYAWGMNRTPPGPLKIVMDATELKFLDHSFGTVTSFFTLMYMKPEAQQKALREAHRVLKPGGQLRIWEVELPALADPNKDVVVFPFRFQLPNETIETGYGTFFPRQPMDAAYYKAIAKAAGFQEIEVNVQGNRLTLKATRN